MKIVMHGATNGSNFGDIILASLFHKMIVHVNGEDNTFFYESFKYGVGGFLRKELNYNNHLKFSNLFKADFLIYFSGGYFGENNAALKESMIRYLRYCLVGNVFMLLNKPIAILGIGGGPITNKFLRKAICKLINYAKFVYVRDEETKNYFVKFGCSADHIKVTTDTAQVITPDIIPPLETDVLNDIVKIFGHTKKIFLHLPNVQHVDEKFSQIVIPALNRFLKLHEDYGVVIGNDGMMLKDFEGFLSVKGIISEKIYFYKYHSAWQLCSLLNNMDLIITPKLHVGIIGASLSKSVLSFPYHNFKTQRYFRQINEIERCILLKEVNEDTAFENIKNYYNKPIMLNNAIRHLAISNLTLLGNILNLPSNLNNDFQEIKGIIKWLG